MLDKKDDSHTDSVWSTAWASGENADLFLTGSVDESVKSWKGVDNKVTWDHTWTGHTLGEIDLLMSMFKTLKVLIFANDCKHRSRTDKEWQGITVISTLLGFPLCY